MIKNILNQLNDKLNDGFFPDDLDVKSDRFFAATLLLSKQECLFLKNILEDVKDLNKEEQ